MTAFSHLLLPPLHFQSSTAIRLSLSSEMDTSAGQGLYPLKHCKIVHLVRHAQALHNVAGEKDYEAYSSYDYLDSSLTPLGWQQVDNLRKHVQQSGLSKNIELVILSPFTRVMQTAVGVFGGVGIIDGTDIKPLMVADAESSGRPAISSLDCPPFLAVELCRERLGVHPCDKRRSKRLYELLFPAIDFSLIENDEDVLWKENIREKYEDMAERGMQFMKWLWTREENEIAVVTHSGFLFRMLSNFGNDCHEAVKNEICSHFANCELRSMVFVNKGFTSSDSSETNSSSPGKLSNGL